MVEVGVSPAPPVDTFEGVLEGVQPLSVRMPPPPLFGLSLLSLQLLLLVVAVIPLPLSVPQSHSAPPLPSLAPSEPHCANSPSRQLALVPP